MNESNNIDLSVATTQLNAMATAVQEWITTNAPVLVGILGAALVLTLIFLAYKWIKRGTSKAG